MNLSTILLLLLLILVVSVGQILFKLVSGSVGNLSISSVILVLLNPYFILAVGAYAFSTILWVVVLKRIELSKAYPFVALTFVLVPAAGFIFFGEKISVGLGLGIGFILTGVLVICFYG